MELLIISCLDGQLITKIKTPLFFDLKSFKKCFNLKLSKSAHGTEVSNCV